jgi:hypothetical protein
MLDDRPQNHTNTNYVTESCCSFGLVLAFWFMRLIGGLRDFVKPLVCNESSGRFEHGRTSLEPLIWFCPLHCIKDLQALPHSKLVTALASDCGGPGL